MFGWAELSGIRREIDQAKHSRDLPKINTRKAGDWWLVARVERSRWAVSVTSMSLVEAMIKPYH